MAQESGRTGRPKGSTTRLSNAAATRLLAHIDDIIRPHASPKDRHLTPEDLLAQFKITASKAPKPLPEDASRVVAERDILLGYVRRGTVRKTKARAIFRAINFAWSEDEFVESGQALPLSAGLINTLTPYYVDDRHGKGIRFEMETAIETILNREQRVAIVGCARSGKTQAAISYFSRSCERYRHTLWIQCESKASVEQGALAIAKKLKLVEEGATYDLVPSKLRDWLHAQERYLLVLDNVTDIGIVKPLLPDSLSGHLIATSKLGDLSNLGIASRVLAGPFSPIVARNFLKTRAEIEGDAQDQDLLDLAESLSGNPGALELAAIHLWKTCLPVREFVDELQKRGDFQGGPGAFLDEFSPEEKRIGKAFSLNFALLRSQWEDAEEAYGVFCFFSRAHIPFALSKWAPNSFRQVFKRERKEPVSDLLLRHLVGTSAGIGLAYQVTSSSGNEAPKSFLVPGFFQSLYRASIERLHWMRLLGHATQILRESLPTWDEEYWPRWLSLHPHVEMVVTLGLSHFEQLPLDLQVATDELAVLVEGYESKSGTGTDLIPRAEASISRRTELFGRDHRNTAEAYNNLGFHFQRIGQDASALPIHLEALEIKRKIFSDPHEDIALSLHNIALVQHQLADFEDAHAKVLQAIDTWERLPKSKNDLAASLRLFAAIKQQRGDCKGAVKTARQAVELVESLEDFGPAHVDAARSYRILAEALRASGQKGEALKAANHARDIVEAISAKHPYLIEIRKTLDRLML